MRKFLLLFLLTAAFAISVAAQPRFAGKVGEVIDGRTLLVETRAGKMRVQLQFIEVPEPDQAFASVVKQHLSKLTVGNTVEFRPIRLADDRTVGLVTLGDVDLSLQMIRDGAAWHEPVKISGQTAASAAEYASNQQQAKAEKRGVWFAKDLKTPDQLRAEREAAMLLAEAQRRVKNPSLVGLGEFQSDGRGMANHGGVWANGAGLNEMAAWGNLFAGVGKEGYGLNTYSDPQGRFDAVYTSAVFVNVGVGSTKRRLECRAILVIVNMPNGQRQNVYVVGFQSVASEYYFSKRKGRLSFGIGKKNLPVGVPIYSVGGESFANTREIVIYRIGKAALKSIAAANSVDVRIDAMSGTLPNDARDLFKQFADTMD